MKNLKKILFLLLSAVTVVNLLSFAVLAGEPLQRSGDIFLKEPLPTLIRSIDITAAEPVAGEKPDPIAYVTAEPAESLKTNVLHVAWKEIDIAGYLNGGTFLKPVTAFEEGKLYYVTRMLPTAVIDDPKPVLLPEGVADETDGIGSTGDATVSAKIWHTGVDLFADGYAMDSRTVITVNGQRITDSRCFGAILGPVGKTVLEEVAIQTADLQPGPVAPSVALVAATPADGVITAQVSVAGWVKTDAVTPAYGIAARYDFSEYATKIESGAYYLPVFEERFSELIAQGYGINPALTRVTLNGEALYDAGYRVKAIAAEIVFEDVKEGAYYASAVDWALNKRVTNGKSGTVFSPDENCTRGQAITFIWRALGSPAPATVACPFSDVKESDYCYQATLWAAENGVTKGTDGDTFSPDKICSRGEVVTLLWRAVDEPEPTVTCCSFTDATPAAYYYEAMLWAVEKGVTNGMSETAFGPNVACSRGQIVTFLYRSDSCA